MIRIMTKHFVFEGSPRLLVIAAVITLALGASQTAMAETITIISGGGPIGSLDPVNEFTLDGGVTYQPAYIISPHPFYSIFQAHTTSTGTPISAAKTSPIHITGPPFSSVPASAIHH